ncbi:MAG: hypothetical protein ACLP7Q_21815 [Isosphaeraceae bacterium]
MANTFDNTSPSTGPYPEELRSAIAIEAETDADRVAALILAMGYNFTPSKPLVMERELLLFYGAVLRLHSWENAGIRIHRDRGFPSACEILTDAARALREEGTMPDGTGLSIQVTNMFMQNFAWNGRRELDAPVVLDFLDDKMAVDALAKLLWSRRLVARGERA